jgi:hypothetical protein
MVARTSAPRKTVEDGVEMWAPTGVAFAARIL